MQGLHDIQKNQYRGDEWQQSALLQAYLHTAHVLAACPGAH